MIERQRPTRFWLVAALSSALALALVPSATPKTLVPRYPTTFFGVSDRGSVAEFKEFAGFVEKHPAVLQTFHPWGNSLKQAVPRWQAVNVRPMLHISTQDDETLEELITPKAIARGRGDNYLLRLNRVLARNDIRIYLRPLGEPNRCLNAWAGLDCAGGRRGGSHSYRWYKRAFRRIVVIVRGGGTLDQMNRRLRAARVPRLNRRGGGEPRRLPPAPVASVWSPLPAGSPRSRASRPRNYWPGDRWVDWAGTDFYSQYPHWRDLESFFRGRPWREKPFAITEFAVAGSDSPTFIRRVFNWAYKRSRVRMLIYYRGFGESGNNFRLGLYPESTRALKRRLNQRRFPAYAPGHATKPDRAARRGGGEPTSAIRHSGPLG
jgi:hypothetical protein